jgi:hypothetical protein
MKRHFGKDLRAILHLRLRSRGTVFAFTGKTVARHLEEAIQGFQCDLVRRDMGRWVESRRL